MSMTETKDTRLGGRLLLAAIAGGLVFFGAFAHPAQAQDVDGSGIQDNTVTKLDLVPALSGQIDGNTADIATNTADIATNRTNIDINTTNIGINAGNIYQNAMGIAKNAQRIDENSEGVAMAIAMGGTFLPQAGETFRISGNWNNFEGSNALAFSSAISLTKGAYVTAGAGFGLEENTFGSRAGVSLGW